MREHSPRLLNVCHGSLPIPSTPPHNAFGVLDFTQLTRSSPGAHARRIGTGKRRVRRPWRRFRARPHCSSVWQSRVGRGQRARARSALMRYALSPAAHLLGTRMASESASARLPSWEAWAMWRCNLPRGGQWRLPAPLSVEVARCKERHALPPSRPVLADDGCGGRCVGAGWWLVSGSRTPHG